MNDPSNKEMEMLKKNQTEILKMKSSIRSDKNSFERLNNKLDQAEEKILKTILP